MENKGKLLAIGLIWGISLSALQGQTGATVTVTGDVYDQKRRPIAKVQVFLANTTMGGTTSGAGTFRLRHIPAGTYDLVVFAPGYNLRELTITVDPSRRNRFDFRMREAGKSAPTTETQDGSGREKKLRKFEEAFFSTTDNSLECEILNPDVLDFPDISAKAFHAFARGPIVFENRALGYKVTYHLKEFEVDIHFTKYGGLSRFEELSPADTEESLKWRFNRLRAFRGSLRHFFAVLQENFARQAKDNAVLRDEGFFVAWILNRRKEMAEPYAVSTFNRQEHRQFDVNNFLKPGSSPGVVELNFPNYWQIRYTNEREEEGFLRIQGIQPRHRKRYEKPRLDGLSNDQLEWISGDVGDQKSLIKLTGESLKINTTSNHFDQAGLEMHGYLSWQGMADTLPREYDLNTARSEKIAFSNVLRVEN